MLAPVTTPLGSAVAELLEAHRKTELTSVTRSLHDDIGPALCGIGLQMSVLRTELSRSSPEAFELASGIQDALERAVDAVRHLNYLSDPALAERCGLGAALEALLSHPPAGFSGQATVERSLVEPPNGAESAAAFRIAREVWRAAAAAPSRPFRVQVRASPVWTVRIEHSGGLPSPHLADLFRLWASESGLTLEIDPSSITASWAGK